jgi:hypothetical protein
MKASATPLAFMHLDPPLIGPGPAGVVRTCPGTLSIIGGTMLMSRLRSLATGASLALLVGIPSAGAQPDTVPGSIDVARLGTLCWRRVEPAPVCRAWVATEFAYEHPFALTRFAEQSFDEDDFDGRVVLSVGPMFNVRPNAAVGAMLASTVDANGIGVLRTEARYRRWIGRRTGVDLGAGFAQTWVPTTGDPRDDIRARGITGGIGIEHRFVGIDARLDWLNGGGEPWHAALIGVRTSSSGSAVAAGVLFIVGIIGFIAFPYERE